MRLPVANLLEHDLEELGYRVRCQVFFKIPCLENCTEGTRFPQL